MHKSLKSLLWYAHRQVYINLDRQTRHGPMQQVKHEQAFTRPEHGQVFALAERHSRQSNEVRFGHAWASRSSAYGRSAAAAGFGSQ